MEWQPIETAPLGEMVLLWDQVWRHAFPGQRNGKAMGYYAPVYVDTCETEAKGWQPIASHWMPLPKPPRTASAAPER